MNIAMLLDMAADGLGDRVAFGSRADGMTFSALRGHATAIAERLDTGVHHTLALTSETGPIVPAALFGAAWAGVAYAPINYRLPDPARIELLHRLRPAEVADAPWLDLAPAPGRAFPDAPTRPAVLLFTSGTSAEPKAAVLEHSQLLAYQLNTMEFAAVAVEADLREVWRPAEFRPRWHSQWNPRSIEGRIVSLSLDFPKVHWWTCGSRNGAMVRTFKTLEMFWRKKQQCGTEATETISPH
jgi:acyl-CoA synthetase (AMP-forming)/AMP-acid ligase II